MSAYGFGGMIQKLKKNPKTIVFTEGTDARILEAASRLLASNFLTPILVGNEDEIMNAAEEEGYNIRGAQVIDPLNYDRFEEMVDAFCELRKSKGMAPEKARPILSQANYLQFAPHCRSLRRNPATASYLPASFWSVQRLPAEEKLSQWATARSTSILPRTIWSRSAARLQSVRKSLVLIPKSHSFLSQRQVQPRMHL